MIGYNKVLIFLMLFAVVVVASCQNPAAPGPGTENLADNISQEQQPTVDSGYDIPTFLYEPTGLPSTYDQIEISPAAGFLSYPTQLSTANITLDTGADALHVEYRSNIDSYPDQIRYNIINMWIPGKILASENVTFRLTNMYPDITVERTVWIGADWDGHYGPALKINISPRAAPGYYNYKILTFINGKYQGGIRFTLHIMKYPPSYVSDNVSSSSASHRHDNNVLIALIYAPLVDQEISLQCVVYSDTGCDNATAWLVMPETASALTGNLIYSGKIEKGKRISIKIPIVFHEPGHYEILALAQFRCNPNEAVSWGFSAEPITVGYDKSLIGTEPYDVEINTIQ
jgi:hypothetical protein